MVSQMKFDIDSLEELNSVTQQIIAELRHKIVLFEGQMGTGKTTLIKEIISAMGSEDEASSPTFSIVNEYETKTGKVFHFDFYRIKSEEEAMDFGVEEYLYSGDYCFIEWPERIQNLIPEPHHTVKINVENNSRTIIFA